MGYSYSEIHFGNKKTKEYFDKLDNMSGKDFNMEFRTKYGEYCNIINNSQNKIIKKRKRNLTGIFRITPGRIKNSQGVTYGLIKRKENDDEKSK